MQCLKKLDGLLQISFDTGLGRVVIECFESSSDFFTHWQSTGNTVILICFDNESFSIDSIIQYFGTR